MEILTSAEVRWFFEGIVPAVFEHWFSRSDLMAIEASSREDYYLPFPASTVVGVKFREGKLEIKPMIKVLGVKQFAKDVAGNVQTWEKWSLGDAGVLKLQEVVLIKEGSFWVKITKARKLRKFTLEGERIEEVNAEKDRPAEGCNAELTDIKLGDRQFWSFGFEAFGAPSKVVKYLDQVARLVFAQKDRPEWFLAKVKSEAPFSSKHSLSYPKWLKTRKDFTER